MGKVGGAWNNRASGKTRINTPKVPKQPKKKQIQGRAKKRIIFNKRFLTEYNSIIKRSPNSQPIKYFI